MRLKAAGGRARSTPPSSGCRASQAGRTFQPCQAWKPRHHVLLAHASRRCPAHAARRPAHAISANWRAPQAYLSREVHPTRPAEPPREAGRRVAAKHGNTSRPIPTGDAVFSHKRSRYAFQLDREPIQQVADGGAVGSAVSVRSGTLKGQLLEKRNWRYSKQRLEEAIEVGALLDDGIERADRHRDPGLRLDRIP